MQIKLAFVTIIFMLFLIPNPSIANNHDPQVAIIIDDFGGDVRGVTEFLDSEIPITVAVMPFLSHSREHAELAHSKGLEVIIHLPLQPKKGKKSWLGPKAITKDLSLTEVKNRVTEAIESVPHAKGINNHMGSLIVEDEDIMRVILETAHEHGLYFIDSGTSPHSTIPKLAEEIGIPWASRDIFLDDTMSSSSHVYKQIINLVKVAELKGQAIGIGHVGIKGDQTVSGVKQGIKELEVKKINVVPTSKILKTRIDKNPDEFWQ